MHDENEQLDPKPAPPADPSPTAPAKNGGGKRKRAGLVLAILLVIGGVAGGWLWVRTKTHVATDNAFVDAHVHAVSARVPGTVARVAVTDNLQVHEGDLLVQLDPGDYRVRVDNADAEVEMARNETSGDHARVEAARAAVGLATARLEQTDLDLQRGRNLFAKEVIPKEQLDRLETARRVAASQLREAEENQHKEEALAGSAAGSGREARIRQKEARLDEARLNLSYVNVYAPTDGYVTRKGVESGNYVQPGQQLMSIVDLDGAWITANYKESQLTDVRPGHEVTFTVDSYPGKTFRGRVESIMAGTGAAFSLLPPENATGNYVKVVQRVPVKITIDKGSDPEHLLRVGMSVVPTILTGRGMAEVLMDLIPFK
jgi:membrane fusion protein (multidrug efflux system)